MSIPLTPTIVTAWLACPHSLTLHRLEHEGVLEKTVTPVGNFARMVQERGEQHERECLEALRQRLGAGGVFEPQPAKDASEGFGAYLARVPLPHLGAYRALYQIPMVCNGMRGIADFLLAIDGDGQPLGTFMPVDAKLARKEAKPGHVLQLCFYADAIEQVTGKRPTEVQLWLGSHGAGKPEVIRLAEVDGYWRRVRERLMAEASAPAPAATTPEPCAHCAYCKYQGRCESEWKAADALHYVARVSSRDRLKLEPAGITTRAALATSTHSVDRLDDKRLQQMRLQARLQMQAQPDPKVLVEASTSTPFVVLTPDSAEKQPKGFALLPPADDGDVFLDYEGHPFFTVQESLIFLFGLLYKNDAGAWVYEARWAHNKPEELLAAQNLVTWLEDRLAKHPSMRVYHYNHTERSTLSSILDEQASDDSLATLRALMIKDLFVDVYTIVRQALCIGVPSYSLKHVEKVAGYDRDSGPRYVTFPPAAQEAAAGIVAKGADAVMKYETYLRSSGSATEDERAALLASIARYNLHDVEATLAVCEWLRGLRPADATYVGTVAASGEENSVDGKSEKAIALEGLLSSDGSQGEHLLGYLLAYYDREWKMRQMQIRVKLDMPMADLVDDEEAIVNPTWTDPSERKETNKIVRGALPSQQVSPDWFAGNGAMHFWDGGEYSSKVSLAQGDKEAAVVCASWPESRDVSECPTIAVYDADIQTASKSEVLLGVARARLGSGSVPLLARRLLTRETPPAPAGGYTASAEAILAHLAHHEGSVVPVQGPPGTGKTYLGAELIRLLVCAGKSVGIVANSHAAAINLLQAACARAKHHGQADKLIVAHRTSGQSVPGATVLKRNYLPSKKTFNLFVGSAWFFAFLVTKNTAVDYLFVDEAGQFALADALAVSASARNMVLLGDPLQLPQVTQAVHPEGAGASVLEHMLDGAPTVSASRGVFLDTTYRMHPDVCAFISDTIYEGKLGCDTSCAQQTVHGVGTGLRVKLMHHAGCSDRSDEEADEVYAIASSLLGKPWTNHQGVTQPMTHRDIIVVAPYNAHRRAIGARLAGDPSTADIQVGTVDKFQGQEAAAVIFSMAASSSADIPRGADFLFNRNRLNVAISRARCLAYIIVNEALLDSRARDLEQMRLISTLCSAVEAGEPV